QTGAGQVGAARIRGRTDAVVEEAANVIAGTKRRDLDVDTRQHGPAPLVVRIAAERGAGRGNRAVAGGRRRAGVVGGVDLVEDCRHTKAAPALVDRKVQPRGWMLIGPE